MRNEFTWMLFLLLPLVMVTSRAVREDGVYDGSDDFDQETATEPEDIPQTDDGGVISVSITSSVAIDRGTGKSQRNLEPLDDLVAEPVSLTPVTAKLKPNTKASNKTKIEKITSELAGANIEFIKQLHSKKEARGTNHLEAVHPFQLQIMNIIPNDTNVVDQGNVNVNNEELNEATVNIPLGRSVALSPSSRNYIQGLSQSSERGQGPRLTTVSFNIAHDTPKPIPNYHEHSQPAPQAFPDLQQMFNQAPKIYSQPAKVYSEPAKIYSEPAKVYSEPAKVYSEPAKIYSEPAKIYSEPAKFYSPAASLNLPPQNDPMTTVWDQTQPPTTLDASVPTTPALSTSAQPAEYDIIEHQPEKFYEINEKDSVSSDGRMHGLQKSPENCKDESCKVGYVVQGRQYRKYRVEEKTSDGFIVGEYGVVRNEDGALRGVRYTADSGAATPRLIYDALMKFLQL
ncbi:uncharacterized protein [Choristoneura fumiferana]|uniref:uncharacterized protein n=1 Tax=Choristoneura fumiferana TaxID=7141 RepID=UPI003D15BA62